MSITPSIDVYLQAAATNPDQARIDIAEAKDRLGFDAAIAARFVNYGRQGGVFDQAGLAVLARRVEALVRDYINPEIKSIILDPDPRARRNEGRGRSNRIRGLVAIDEADPLWALTRNLLHQVYPCSSNERCRPFIRARVTNCLVAIRSAQKSGLA